MNPAFATPRAAYVHVPFCRRRCGYCNFTLVAGRNDLVDAYLQAVECELTALGPPHEVDTLFFGGGTPTHLPAAALARLLNLAQRHLPLAPAGELSVEANPEDLNDEVLSRLAAGGVTRISLGGQSFDSGKLKSLEREHSGDVLRAAVLASKKFVSSVALDLIFGAPGETLEVWRADLASALALGPHHLSTYGLTFERGTTFWSRLLDGELARIDEVLECSMYTHAIDTLHTAGFEQYEVSNFALNGHRCRHNDCYWLGHTYFAVGPGAARYVNGRRETNHRSTTTYLKRVLAGQSPVAESEMLDPEDRAREALVFQLRRLEGVVREEFAAHTGFEVDSLVGRPLARMAEQGLLDDDGRRVALSRRGLLISDAIWPHFLRR
jgi:oxygen-independent coproporphyrinogen-3 oxidase